MRVALVSHNVPNVRASGTVNRVSEPHLLRTATIINIHSGSETQIVVLHALNEGQDIFCPVSDIELLGNAVPVHDAVVASIIALFRSEPFAEISQDLCSTTIRSIEAVCYDVGQNFALTLLLLLRHLALPNEAFLCAHVTIIVVEDTGRRFPVSSCSSSFLVVSLQGGRYCSRTTYQYTLTLVCEVYVQLWCTTKRTSGLSMPMPNLRNSAKRQTGDPAGLT